MFSVLPFKKDPGGERDAASENILLELSYTFLSRVLAKVLEKECNLKKIRRRKEGKKTGREAL